MMRCVARRGKRPASAAGNRRAETCRKLGHVTINSETVVRGYMQEPPISSLGRIDGLAHLPCGREMQIETRTLTSPSD